MSFKKVTLLSVLVLIICALIAFETFKDQLFSNNDVLELLSHQGIILKDPFEILDNSTSSAIGDYSHTFTLQLSSQEVDRLLLEFRSAENYVNLMDSSKNRHEPYIYFTKKLRSQYFEKDKSFIQKFHEPIAGYAPNFRIITIEKDTKHLIFEEVDD
ncbi:MAG: hypothetical protein ACJA0X_002804 [Cyclobacteriaceae bacterium]|jgi:hypothetical protein